MGRGCGDPGEGCCLCCMVNGALLEVDPPTRIGSAGFFGQGQRCESSLLVGTSRNFV